MFVFITPGRMTRENTLNCNRCASFNEDTRSKVKAIACILGL